MYAFRFHVIENITRTSASINRAFTGMRFHARQFALGINEGYREALQLEGEAGRLERAQRRAFNPGNIAGFSLSLRNLTGIAAGIFGGIGVVDFAQRISTAQQATEKYAAVLGVAFQNANKAQIAIKGVTQFAIANRLNIDATTDSYISLVNRGFAPSLVQMQRLTDFALSKKKGVDQYVEAILDAETFEFERLKEFGVRFQKTGNTIQATYNGQTQSIGANADAVRAYLLGLGELEGVKGTAAAIAKTTGGFLQNLQNQARQLALGFGAAFQPITSNLLPRFGSMLENLVGWVQRNQESITRWASTFIELGVRALAVWGIFQLYIGSYAIFSGVQFVVSGLVWGFGRLLTLGYGLIAQLSGLAVGLARFGYSAVLATGQAVRAVGLYIASLWGARGIQYQMFLSFAWARIVAGFAVMRLAVFQYAASLTWANVQTRLLSGISAIRALVVGFAAAAVPSIIAFASSLNFAAIGQALLNTLMLANPVGLIIAGVLGLAAAFYGLFKLIDTLFPGFFKGVKEWFGKAWDFIYNTFIAPVVKFFKWLGNITGISAAFDTTGQTAGAGPKPGDPDTAAATALAGFKMPMLPNTGLGKGSRSDIGVNKELENSVSGSRAGIKNINVTIGKMIESLSFNTTTLTENKEVIRRELERLLLDVANDVNYAK